MLFTSTLVMGCILPVATTERATSPRCTLAMRLGSMFAVRTRRAAPTPRTTMKRSTTEPIQIQIFLLLRDAMEHLPARWSYPLPEQRMNSKKGRQAREKDDVRE